MPTAHINQLRELRCIHARIAMWGLLSYLFVLCVACKGHLLPDDGNLSRWFVRLAIVAASDLALVALLGAALLIAGRYASRGGAAWKVWRSAAAVVCGVVGVYFVMGMQGFSYLSQTPTLTFWVEECRRGLVGSQIVQRMSPYSLAWLLIAVVGPVAAPWIARLDAHLAA